MGETASEEAGKKIATEVWEKAKNIWVKLRPKLENKPAALEAAHDVAECPTDADAISSFRHHLKKLLSDDPPLMTEIMTTLGNNSSATSVMIKGNNNFLAGDITLTGDGIVIGDNDTVIVKKG